MNKHRHQATIVMRACKTAPQLLPDLLQRLLQLSAVQLEPQVGLVDTARGRLQTLLLLRNKGFQPSQPCSCVS